MIERNLRLNYSKWDTRVDGVSTLSCQPLVIPRQGWTALCKQAEALASETLQHEAAISARPDLQALIGVPRRIRDALARNQEIHKNGSSNACRAMRFDFHPTCSGWRVSEVNSDVPGGWREGSTLPLLYLPYFEGLRCPESPLDAWGRAISSAYTGGHVAVLYAPGHLEDEQVARSFGGELRARNIPFEMIQNPSVLEWSKDSCFLRRSGTLISLVVRFYQIEWLFRSPRRKHVQLMFSQPNVPTFGPLVCAISENKRFALGFDASESSAWKTFVPECRDPRDLRGDEWDEWALKRAYSNTGDGVHLCGLGSLEADAQLIRDAKRKPAEWVAQRRFVTLSVDTHRGPMYPCIGVFVVNGRAAGAYARLSNRQVTDGAAVDAPLLISGGAD